MPSPVSVPSTAHRDLSPLGFRLGLLSIFVVSLALRFWGLSRFNTLVFDEVYYARFASHFLKQELIFTGHPPLSTYIIAIGIGLGEQLPWSEGVKNGLSGLFLSPFSYRWLNALTGSLIPLVVAAIAYQLSHRRWFSLIAALLIAADGLLLVESRYALNNVYLIILGLLGQLFFLLALPARSAKRWAWLAASGVCFGATAAIKWNGLGFLLGAYLVWIAGWLLRGIVAWRRNTAQNDLQDSSPKITPSQAASSPFPPALQNLTQLHLGHILICLALVPALTYYLSWLPYLQLDPNSSFWELQTETLGYHQRVGGLTAHPYCSLWYTWPLMLRPIAYFYQTAHQVGAPAPVVGPPTPNDAGIFIYDVHAMGNPFLWWLSTAATLLLLGLLIPRLWQWAFSSNHTSPRGTLHLYDWIGLYLISNWAANFLPWIKVTRCVFLYHYLPSLVFSVLMLALVVDRWLHSPFQQRRMMGFTVVFLVVIAFIFWMPLYLGMPLSPSGLGLRRWLSSWI